MESMPRSTDIRTEGRAYEPFSDPFGGILEPFGGCLEAFGRADFAPLTITEAAFLLGFGISTPFLPPLFIFNKTKKVLRGPVYR
jgi:hypothetical protein